MMAGALSLACENRSLDAAWRPRPRTSSTKSDPEMEKKGLASPATARARRVLPVPGRPLQQDALGDLRADRLELAGSARKSLISCRLLDGLLGAGDVRERRRRHRPCSSGLGLAELHDAGAAALHLAHEEEEEQDDEGDREQGDEQRDQDALGRDHHVVAARQAVRRRPSPGELLLQVDALAVDVRGAGPSSRP